MKKVIFRGSLYSVSIEFRGFIHENSKNIARDDNTSAISIPNTVKLRNGYITHYKAENRDYLLTINSNGTIRQRILLSEKINQAHDFLNTYGAITIRGDWWSEFYKDMGNVSKEGDITFANGKKPVRLIKQIIYMLGLEEGDIILDFFSGSATTAHAVMQLNAEDGGNRKFIMVQLPEACDQKSEAYKAGYKTIVEIGKERIRRAGKKIKAENTDKAGIDQLDIGFRVLKVDSSNMKDVYYTPDKLKQGDLDQFTDNIRDDSTPEDLLFQVLLDWGVDLTLPITQETIAGFTVLFVDDNALAACFDADINEDFVKELAARHPMRVVFRDAGFASDSVKINIEQIFKLMSPATEIKVI